jgi:hypothetical protein
MARTGARECQVVRILDADGTPLTTATTQVADDGRLALDEIDDPGTLMDYYFGRGERLVVVDVAGSMLEGLLDTRWQSADRAWWVGFSKALTAFLMDPSADDTITRIRQPVR